MKYFKNENNEVFAYDDEQVSQGYGKDMEQLEVGEFVDADFHIKPYKLDDSYVEVERDEDGNVTAPQSYIDYIQAEAQAKTENEAVNEAKQYLANTDFYYARQMETGEEVPADVVTNRAAYREFLRSKGL